MKVFSGKKGSVISLLPLLIFVFTFLGAGIALGDFYALPSPIAVLLGIVTAFLLFRDQIEDKVSTLLKGCGDEKIMTMCLIYLLAGAFTMICKATGSVEAIVDLGLNSISVHFLYAGIFIITAFLSFSTGTSVGAIVALATVVTGFADRTGASLPILSASLLGGAMFGDNLSFISDTTIAATQSLGCDMKDKFRQNLKIALPAAAFTIGILLFQGFLLGDSGRLATPAAIDLVKIVPYLLVISLAILGMNVYIVLFAGLAAAGGIGLFYSPFDLPDLAGLSYSGFTSMTDIFLLSMLTGGLAAMVTKAGGLDLITRTINRWTTKRSAYFGIGILVGITNLAIANNTVSILVSGNIARQINEKLKLSRIKTASVLDIFACIIQGILPYGAQVLLILSFAKGRVDYFQLISNAWHLWFLLASTLTYFLLQGRQERTRAAMASVIMKGTA